MRINPSQSFYLAHHNFFENVFQLMKNVIFYIGIIALRFFIGPTFQKGSKNV